MHSARIHDATAGLFLLQAIKERFPSIKKIWGDSGYRGPLADWFYRNSPRRVLTIVKRCAGRFEVLPKRWIVERTFGWLNWSRRLSKDYETHPESSRAMVLIAMIRIMLNRLE